MSNQPTAPAEKQLPIANMGGSISNAFNTGEGFALAYRMGQALATSDLVPAPYKGNPANCMVALEIANRIGASALMVVQNLNVIHGRPSWSSQFIVAALNSCGRFTPLRFRKRALGAKDVEYEYWTGTKGVDRRKEKGKIKLAADFEYIAVAKDKATGDELEGPPVTLEMAVREGWYTRTDSKWVNMPELMLTYRAAAFFGRLYAPDVLMGMHSADELLDVEPIDVTPGQPAAAPVPAGPAADLNTQVQEASARKRKAKEKEAGDAKPQELPATNAAGTPLGFKVPANAAVGQEFTPGETTFVLQELKADADGVVVAAVVVSKPKPTAAAAPAATRQDDATTEAAQAGSDSAAGNHENATSAGDEQAQQATAAGATASDKKDLF